MSALVTTANRFRAEILARERQAATVLLRAYGEAWKRIADELAALLAHIAQAEQSGETINRAWLRQSERLQQLQAQVEIQMARFVYAAAPEIFAQQRAAVEAAQRQAHQLTLAALPAPEAARVVGTWNRLPIEAVEQLVGSLQPGSPLRVLLDNVRHGAGEAVGQVLTTGLARGQNPRDIARDVRREMGGRLTRALTISRTEVMRAYRAASLASYQENDDVVDGWIWIAALSGRTCAMCLAMHGTEHPLSEAFGSHPNCRCTAVPKTKSWEELGVADVEETRPDIESGEAWFARQDETTQEDILGSHAAQQAFLNDEVTLADFVGEKRSPAWGLTRYARSLKEVLAEAT